MLCSVAWVRPASVVFCLKQYHTIARLRDHLEAPVKCHAIFLQNFDVVDPDVLQETLARMAKERKALKDQGFTERKAIVAPLRVRGPLRLFN